MSDLQIPYEAPNALGFVKYIKKHYKIEDDNCLCVGDETDQFHGSIHPKGGDYEHTPAQELKIAKEKLQEWYSAFPKMKLAISNHGLRWVRKAAHAEIPSEVLRDYRELIDAPDGWRWQERWLIKGSKAIFMMTHGMEYGGMYAFRNAPLIEGISTCFGHLHSSAGIAYLHTGDDEIWNQKLWGMNAGCLIDIPACAFKYGKYNKYKPNLGIGIVANGGTMPIWIPYD